jgi:hypothetical protein
MLGNPRRVGIGFGAGLYSLEPVVVGSYALADACPRGRDQALVCWFVRAFSVGLGIGAAGCGVAPFCPTECSLALYTAKNKRLIRVLPPKFGIPLINFCYNKAMSHLTITIPDTLKNSLEVFVQNQQQTQDQVIQAALENYLGYTTSPQPKKRSLLELAGFVSFDPQYQHPDARERPEDLVVRQEKA